VYPQTVFLLLLTLIDLGSLYPEVIALLSHTAADVATALYRPGHCSEILKFVLKYPEIGVGSENSYTYPEIFNAFSQL